MSKTEALGIVVQANRANLGEHPVSEGSSVFDGEEISTEERGMLQLRSGPVQFNLLGESRAMVRGNADVETQAFSAEVEKGAGVLTSPAGANSEICAHGACVRPEAGGPVTVQVSVTGPKQLKIYARRGKAIFTYKRETAVIAEGATYIVLLDPPDDGSSTGQDGSPNGRRGKGYILIAVASAVIVPILIHELFESPDRP